MRTQTEHNLRDRAGETLFIDARNLGYMKHEEEDEAFAEKIT